MMNQKTSLIIWILLFQLIGFGIGLFAQSNITTWYPSLHKSLLTPPNFVFPIVWSLLYVILAIVGWLLWRQRQAPKGKMIFSLYLIQIFMNWAWTPIFFQWHFIELSFYWIGGIILLVAILLLMTVKRNRLVFILLLPYFLWLCFAAYLTWVICQWSHVFT